MVRGRDPLTQRSETRDKMPPPSSEKCLRELGPLDRNRVHFFEDLFHDDLSMKSCQMSPDP